MNEVTLPPSPNWYLSNILACSKRGTVAWGAKNFIVIGKPAKDNIMKYSIIKDYFKDKVTSLAFCPKYDEPDNPELLICGGDDAKARVLNVDTLELVSEFPVSVEGSKLIAAVDWSAKDNNLACAVTSDGILMYCNIQYKTSQITSLGRLTATCLACCPHNSHLIAIGTKSGLVYIVQKDTILYKMRGHDEDVISLSWCPSDMNVLNDGDKRDLLLASGAKDRNVFIWRAGRDGRYETVLNIPNMPIMASSHKSKLNTTNGTWIAVYWAEPNMLLTSSLWGELLSWNFMPNEKPQCKLFHTFHNRGLFCIATVPKYSNDLTTDFEFPIWSLAQDRWIICCKRNTDPTKPVILQRKIPTQGGFVYCISACPIDTSRIAFGVGDMMLRLWNLSEPHVTTFDIVMHWQKIKGKIRAISWFSEDESTVAFGTGDGRIGVFDAIGTNKPPTLYRQYHRNTIYKLEWVQLESEYFLFSCAEGELVMYKKSAPNDEPMSIIKKGCLEFSWKSNLCLAVALENGSLAFYDKKLKKRGNPIHILRNVVNCLVWHPDNTMTDNLMSPLSNYLAIASDSCSIMILDMTNLIKELEATDTENAVEDKYDDQERTMHRIVATLNGHSDKVVCLAWSPHISGHLVSGSYDNIAQVWNVEKQELIGTYMGHNGPVLCCMWSPLNPQLIITGSSDFTLHVWNYTLSESLKIVDVKAIKKKSKQQKKAKNKKEVHENSSPLQTNRSNEVAISKSQVPQQTKKERKSYFNIYDKVISDKSQIVSFIKNDIKSNQTKKDDTVTKLSLLCENKEDFLTLISNEKSTHDDPNVVTEMCMWNDDLMNNLASAIENHQLNDFLVALTPTISRQTWKETCIAYAHQLIMQNNPQKAVSYLLAVCKIYEAIEVFLNAKMFKEAYALAKCKLDPTDTSINKILEFWAEWAIHKGHLEEAAHCHVKLEQFDQAAKILSRRKDLHCLEVASELAFLSGDEGYGTSLAIDAMTRALMKSNWSKARSLIADIRQVQYLNVHIDAHEIIMSTYANQTELEMMRMWLEGKENNSILQILEEKYDTSYYAALRKKDNTNINPENLMNDNMMEIDMSYQIAMAATCDAKEARLKHLTTALSNVFKYKDTATKFGVTIKEGFFIHILTKLDTKKPTDENSIYAKSNYPVSQSIRSYLCIGLLDWLSKYLKELSIEEETQCIQLILHLLDDIINETNLSYQNKILKQDTLMMEKFEAFAQVKDVVEITDNESIEKETEELKDDINKFNEERVCIPNPKIVFHKAYSIANKLKDDNKSQLSQFLDKLIQELKTFRLLEEN